MRTTFKHISAFCASLLAISFAAATDFNHVYTLPHSSGCTAYANWMNRGTNSGSNCVAIVVGSEAAPYSDPVACYWLITFNTSGVVSASGPNYLPEADYHSYATGVNDSGDICGFGYLVGLGGGGCMPAPWPINHPQMAIVWKNYGSSTSPNYGSSSDTPPRYPFSIKIANNTGVQYASAINNAYVCGGTWNSTPGWYMKLPDLDPSQNTNYGYYWAPTIAPLDVCASIDPDYNHIGGGPYVLKYVPGSPGSYATSTTATHTVPWWDGYVTDHPFIVNALRGNADGSDIKLGGGIYVSSGRYLACYGTLQNSPVPWELTGNVLYKGSDNQPAAMNNDYTMVGYYPFTTGIEYEGAWYAKAPYSNSTSLTYIENEQFFCVTDHDSTKNKPYINNQINYSVQGEAIVCGSDTSGNAALFWTTPTGY